MQRVNRTAQCRRCGGVILKIKPSTGHVFYYCADCNNEVAVVEYDKYETALSTCEECGGDTFKVRITIDGKDNSRECWGPECTNCKGTPRSVYVDNDGKLINKNERELLIMGERIGELEEEIDTKNETISQLEDEISNLSYEIEEKDSLIYDLKNKLDNAKRQISDLEVQVSDLEWEIRKLEN